MIRFLLNRYIQLLPILLLVASLFLEFISYNYVIMGNLIGYSITTNIVLFYVFLDKKYNWLTRLSPIGLCLINLVDIIGLFQTRQDYHISFVAATTTLIILFSIFLQLKDPANDKPTSKHRTSS